MQIKLIVTDLDGTLLTSDKQITPHTADVLRECRRQGINIAFATARPRYFTRNFWFVNPDFLLNNNGCYITQNGKLIKKTAIEKILSDEIIKRLKSEPSIYKISANTGVDKYSTARGINDDVTTIITDFSEDFLNNNTESFCAMSCRYRDFDIVKRRRTSLPLTMTMTEQPIL
jgi:HAD superfamily hydrolase (TIGR01484 family)